ncbi:MAG: MerR family DNA-binding transcriptional regulator [Simplicispira suum]|uniref:MerR family transcriptional regulator n=1 Tax=Simplicispira suum TaxID=2109915 RepID=UPI001C6CF44B|nr:MerR family DNA-binding transcriptional regulator [Simplicispira suum]MBW7834542.1 MerR family DNA-binding transcriptional regulator [Simplicispira suum]
MSDGHTQSAGERQAAATEAARQVLADHFSDDVHSEIFGVTELCRAFDVTPRTLRFYEDKGLLSPRRINGTRVYSRRDHARLVLILRAKALGSSLAEIKQYLDMYGQAGEGREQQLRYVLERTDGAIAELEQKRAHIESSLAELRIINSGVRENLGLPPLEAG